MVHRKQLPAFPNVEPLDLFELGIYESLQSYEEENEFVYAFTLLIRMSLHPLLRAFALYECARGYLREKRWDLSLFYSLELGRLFDLWPLEHYEGLPRIHQKEVRERAAKMKVHWVRIWFDAVTGALDAERIIDVDPTHESFDSATTVKAARVNECLIWQKPGDEEMGVHVAIEEKEESWMSPFHLSERERKLKETIKYLEQACL
ncbi:hypothetical protein BT69DRAFT_1346707 [Atractiella rhizophila]|nr:hypothetical protein BT69DRAFT_1346707 [Atractiella rhizophila]